MTLPLVPALHVHDFSGGVVLLVGLVALALAAIGIRSWRRSGNRALGFVSLAFLVFGVKGLFGAWAIVSRRVGHEDLEVILAFADLVVVLLLALPLMPRFRARTRG